MPHFSAQLTTSNYCQAVVASHEPLIGQYYVQLQSYDTSVLGRTWNGASFDPRPTRPVPMTWEAFNNYLLGLLATDVIVGQSKLQDILEKCRDFTGTTDQARQTRYFYTFFVGQTNFTKTGVSDAMVNVATTCITPAQKNAVSNNWPEA